MGILDGLAPYSGVFEKVSDVVDKAVPDRDLGAKLKAEITLAALEAQREGRAHEAKRAEDDGKSESMLTRNCRPIMCFWLAGLFTAYCFGLTPNVPPEQGDTFMTGIFSIMGIYTGLRSLVDKPVAQGGGILGAFRRG